MHRFAYTPKAFWIHVGLLCIYLGVLAGIDRASHGQFSWLTLQEGWVVMLMLILYLITIDVLFPSRALAKARVEGGAEPKGLAPMPRRAWTAIALTVGASVAILLGLPARWFEGYRGAVGGRMQYVSSMAVGPSGRVALTGKIALRDATWHVTVSDRTGHLWSRSLEDSLSEVAWSGDGRWLGVLDRRKGVLTLHDGATGRVSTAPGPAAIRAFAWLEGGDVMADTEDGVVDWTPGGPMRTLVEKPCLDAVTAAPGGRWVMWSRRTAAGHVLERWNPRMRVLETSVPMPAAVSSLRALSEDRVLVSLSGRGQVDLWSLEARASLGSVPGLSGDAHVTCSPDGRWLVAFPSAEITAKVFDLRRMAWTKTLGHLRFGDAMSFAEGGGELWQGTCGPDFLFLWPLSGPVRRWAWKPEA